MREEKRLAKEKELRRYRSQPEPEEIIKPLPDKDVINDSSYQEEVNNSKSGWVETNSKKLEILNMFGYDYKDLKKVNIWKDTVL